MNLLAMLAIPFLSCVLLAAILGYIGIHVLKREVIFIDIAVAQIAALGAIGAHLILHVPDDSPLTLLCGIGATVLAALFFSTMHHSRKNQLPTEALIGIAYAVATAGALFAIGKSTEGHTHILEMLTGTLLWTTGGQLARTAAALVFPSALLILLHRPLQRLSDGYQEIEKGNRAALLRDFLFYILCGTVITLAVRLAGVVVVFSFLIVPATFSALFAEKWGMRFLLAWLAGILASAAGLLFSYFLDFSAGASIALFLILILAGGALARMLRRR